MMAAMYQPPMPNGAPRFDEPRSVSPQDSTTHYQLVIRQHPHVARVAIGKEKDRKPIDPPPILQLTVSRDKDPHGYYLQSPYFFMSVVLIDGDLDNPKTIERNTLIGTLVSSLHKLKDTDNKDGGFFVFGDLSVRQEGEYRLKFNLYVMQNGTEVKQLASETSEKFIVYPPKTFPGMSESTFLTRSFSDQGVRLRLRKDSRTMTTRKRNSQAAQLAHDSRMSRPRLDTRGYGDDDGQDDHQYAPMPRHAGPQLTTVGLSTSHLTQGHDATHSPQDLRHSSFPPNSYPGYGVRGPPEPRSAHMPPSAGYYNSPISYTPPGSAFSMGSSMAPSPQGIAIPATLPPGPTIPPMQTMPLGSLDYGARDEPTGYATPGGMPGSYPMSYGQPQNGQGYDTQHTPHSATSHHDPYGQHSSQH